MCFQWMFYAGKNIKVMSQFLAYTSGCLGLGGLVEWEMELARMLLYFPALGERKNHPESKSG